MAGLRSSASYQWLSSDVLGQGATGGVYRGWDKKTGKSVAVKTFNSIGLQRPDNVQNREFDILR
jgi:serine/threonine protein kinase